MVKWVEGFRASSDSSHEFIFNLVDNRNEKEAYIERFKSSFTPKQDALKMNASQTAELKARRPRVPTNKIVVSF